jgi:predicted aldo/keto reductase-like oxidoreductase
MATLRAETPNRRSFLQAGGVAAGALALPISGKSQDGAKAADAPVIPKRKLGNTGVEVTMLEQGAIRGSSVDRVLRFSFQQGVRVFDTAKAYGTEPSFKKWFEQEPEVRKQIFLVTKDMPKTPSQLLTMVDERLEALNTDYIDLLFIHGLGDEHSLDDCINMVKGKELKETADAIRKSGKARFIGFSSHHKDRAPIMQAAAEGGIIDAIMLQYRPWLDKDSALNKAIDACWKKGIGLISMKQIAGQFYGDKPEGNILDDVQKRVPTLKEKNLSPFQGLLHAIWTDERISTICVSMRNTDQIRENVEAAKRFEPLKEADIRKLRDASIAHGQTLCADCDGRCSHAAGTLAELGNLTRYLTYHQQLGDRAEARRLYAALSQEGRNWTGADLTAARDACPNKLDFAALLAKVERHLA